MIKDKVKETQHVLTSKKMLGMLGMGRKDMTALLSEKEWNKDFTKLLEGGDFSAQRVLDAMRPFMGNWANRAGCTFPGRPLVEGTGTLKNYNIQAENRNTDNLGAYMQAGRELVENIMGYDDIKKTDPNILVIHASNKETSNSLTLWNMIKRNLTGCSIAAVFTEAL